MNWSILYQPALLLSLALLPGISQAINIEKVAPGVWAALQPDERKFNDCNSLIVAADKFVIVIDAQESAADVKQIIQFAETQIARPVRYLINTHWHSDHTQGNTLYRERYGKELIIIGHSTQAEDIPNRAAVYVRDRVESLKQQLPAAREQLESGIKSDGSEFKKEELVAQTGRIERAEAWVLANENIQFTGPSMTIDDVYTVEAGSASLTIHPKRGHTRGDLLIHFHELNIVATGDLVDAMPYAGHGFPREWLQSLKSLASLGKNTYLPGHGSLLNDQTLIENLIFYFGSLTTQVRALIDAGNSSDDIKAAIDLSTSRVLLAGDDEAAGRFFDRAQEEAIERAIEEINGAPKQRAD